MKLLHLFVFLVLMGFVVAVDTPLLIEHFASWNSSKWSNVSSTVVKISGGNMGLSGSGSNAKNVYSTNNFSYAEYGQIVIIYNVSLTEDTGIDETRWNFGFGIGSQVDGVVSYYKQQQDDDSVDGYTSTRVDGSAVGGLGCSLVPQYQYFIYKQVIGNGWIATYNVNGTTIKRNTTYSTSTDRAISFDTWGTVFNNVSDVIVCQDDDLDTWCNFSEAPAEDTPLTITQASYNVSSAYQNSTKWQTNKSFPVPTYDTTPTITFNVSEAANCTWSNLGTNYSVTYAANPNWSCTTPNSITQSCTWWYDLTIGEYNTYIACARTDLTGQNGSNSTDGPLRIKIPEKTSPTAPSVYSPTNASIYTTQSISINWTASTVDPRNVISHYLVYLINNGGTLNYTIANVSNSTLNKTWINNSIYYGNFTINVSAVDNDNLIGQGASAKFQICRFPITLVGADNITLEYPSSLSYDFNATTNLSIFGFYVNNTVNFTINISTGVLRNLTPLVVGNQTINVTVNNTCGIAASKLFKIYHLDSISPVITYIWPNDSIRIIFSPVNLTVIATDVSNNITVIFYNCSSSVCNLYSQIGNKSIASGGTALMNFSIVNGSSYFWYATAIDSSGNMVNSSISIFSTALLSLNVTLGQGITTLRFQPQPYKFYEKNVSAYQQNTSIGLFHVVNNGSLAITTGINLSYSPISIYAAIKCANNSNVLAASYVNTSRTMIETLSVGGSANIWCWADFNNLRTAFYPNFVFTIDT